MSVRACAVLGCGGAGNPTQRLYRIDDDSAGIMGNQRHSLSVENYVGPRMDNLYLDKHKSVIRWQSAGGIAVSPVVYLPGMSFPAAPNFRATVSDPALDGRGAVMIDYLGSGASDHAIAPVDTMAGHAACIVAVLDHLGGGPFPVVGYSMGGSVAIELARLRPDLVSALLVAEGNLIPGGGAGSRFIESVPVEEFVARAFDEMLKDLRDGAKTGDAFGGIVAKSWAGIDPRALHANAVGLVDLPADLMAAFLGMTIPRTYVYGEKNDPRVTGKVTPDIPDPAVLTTAGVGVRVLAGTGHEMMLANPQGFAKIVADVLG